MTEHRGTRPGNTGCSTTGSPKTSSCRSSRTSGSGRAPRDSGHGRERSQDREHPDRQQVGGGRPQLLHSATQAGNAAQTGPVEGCPPRQSAGCLPKGHRQAIGYFQKHSQEIRRLARSTHHPDFQTNYPISNSAPYQRTFSLSTYADIFAGQRHYFRPFLTPH